HVGGDIRPAGGGTLIFDQPILPVLADDRPLLKQHRPARIGDVFIKSWLGGSWRRKAHLVAVNQIQRSRLYDTIARASCGPGRQTSPRVGSGYESHDRR